MWKSRSQEGKTTHLCLRERDRLRQREGGGLQGGRGRQREFAAEKERESELERSTGMAERGKEAVR